MTELFFFFSSHDPSVVKIALSLGYSLVVNKDYEPDEPLATISEPLTGDEEPFRRFYVLPDLSFISEISIRCGTRGAGRKFNYIEDRVGAAAIDLVFYGASLQDKIRAGSISFQKKTYKIDDSSLSNIPDVFDSSYTAICSYIKGSTSKISNSKTPHNIYVFPDAFLLLKEDLSRSPWSSVKI